MALYLIGSIGASECNPLRLTLNGSLSWSGSTFQADLRDLESLPNVFLRGEQPYHAITNYLSGWDVGTIPFKLLPLTLATNPVKVYEYLTAGRPVVAMMLPELTQAPVSEWVRVASARGVHGSAGRSRS